jgi:enoyl-[acyl-carrier-protein] reductase (NADH)
MSRTEGIIIMLPSGPSLPRQPEELETLSPMGTITDSKEIAEAVVYLTEARHGEVLHVDDGAHVGRW